MATSNVIDKSNYLPMPSADRQFMVRDIGSLEAKAITDSIKSREANFNGEVVEGMLVKQLKTNKKIGVLGLIDTDSAGVRVTRYEAAELTANHVVNHGAPAFDVLGINPDDFETVRVADVEADNRELVRAISKELTAHNIGPMLASSIKDTNKAEIDVQAPDERKKMQGIYKLKSLIEARKEEVLQALEAESDSDEPENKANVQGMKNELFQLSVKPHGFLVVDDTLLNPAQAQAHISKIESASYSMGLQDIEGKFVVEPVGGLKENAIVRLLNKEDAHYLGSTEVRNLETNEHVLIYGLQDADDKVWLRAEGRNEKGRLSAHNEKAFAMIGINADHLVQGTKGMNTRQTPGMSASMWREQAMDNVLSQMSVNSLRTLINKDELAAYATKNMAPDERETLKNDQAWVDMPETMEAVIVDKFATVTRMTEAQMQDYHKYSASDTSVAAETGFMIEQFNSSRLSSTAQDIVILTQQRQSASNSDLSDRFAKEGELSIIAELFDKNGLVEINRATDVDSLAVDFDEQLSAAVTENINTLNTHEIKQALSTSFNIAMDLNSDTSVARLKGDYGLAGNEHPIVGIEKERMARADGTWVEPSVAAANDADVALDLFGDPIPQAPARKNKM